MALAAKTHRMICGRVSALSRRGYFATLGVPILDGRDFRSTDQDGAERVVIISQSVARQLFPGRPAMDRHLLWTDPVIKFIGISAEPRRIVGVVPDLDDENLIPNPTMTVYQPVDQEGFRGRLFVRANNDPYALVPAVIATIRICQATSRWSAPAPLDDIRAEVMTPDRLNAIVFGGFATLALLVSVVGVAGVLAFSVSGRTASSASAWRSAPSRAAFSPGPRRGRGDRGCSASSRAAWPVSFWPAS